MFKLAVLGPIVTSGFGIARQCVDCYRWRPSYGGVPCFGFDSGCIEYRPKARAVRGGSLRRLSACGERKHRDHRHREIRFHWVFPKSPQADCPTHPAMILPGAPRWVMNFRFCVSFSVGVAWIHNSKTCEGRRDR